MITESCCWVKIITGLPEQEPSSWPSFPQHWRAPPPSWRWRRWWGSSPTTWELSARPASPASSKFSLNSWSWTVDTIRSGRYKLHLYVSICGWKLTSPVWPRLARCSKADMQTYLLLNMVIGQWLLVILLILSFALADMETHLLLLIVKNW